MTSPDQKPVKRSVTKSGRVQQTVVYERERPPAHDSLGERDAELWIASVLLFGLGDLVTTGAGIAITGVSESNHLVASLIGAHGFESFVVAKVFAILAFYGLSMVIPRPHSVGVPMALSVLGLAVTSWNAVVVTSVLLF